MLTTERAKHLVSIGGRVRVDPNGLSLNGRTPAAIPILSADSKNAVVKPYRHGGKTEVVPLSRLSEWKAHNTLKDEEARIAASKTTNPSQYIIAEAEKHLFWAGPTGTNKGWTKDIAKAKPYGQIGDARKGIGKLRNAPEWLNVIGEGDKLEAVSLDEAQVRFKSKYPKPQAVLPFSKPATVPAPTTNGHAEGLKRIDLVQQEPSPSPQPLAFEVKDQTFKDLQAAYQEYELYVAATIEAKNRVMTELAKIMNGMKNGDEATGIKA